MQMCSQSVQNGPILKGKVFWVFSYSFRLSLHWVLRMMKITFVRKYQE